MIVCVVLSPQANRLEVIIGPVGSGKVREYFGAPSTEL